MKTGLRQRVLAVVSGLLLASVAVGSAGAATTYSDYAVWGTQGVFIGAGSSVVGMVGARLNNTDYAGQPDAALGMNGGASIKGTANIGEAGSSADVNVANGVSITLVNYVDTFSSGSGFVGTAVQQPGGTDVPAGTLASQSAWPGGLGTGCPTGGPDHLGLGNGFVLGLTPGNYGDIQGGGGGTLTFNGAGDYIIDSISAANGTTIIATPGARVFVCGEVHFGSGTDVTDGAPPNTLLPGQFPWEVAGIGVDAGTNAFTSGGGDWIGNLLVPTRGVHYGNGSESGTFMGYLWADHVDIEHSLVATKPPKKSGVKWNDINGDGVRDPGDVGLPGWTIQLRDSANTSVVATDVTDANGAYEFTDIVPGTYYVCEVQMATWNQTYPNATTPDPVPVKDVVTDQCPAPATYGYIIIVANGDNLNGDDFGNHMEQSRGGSKSGFKFYDVDGDGVYEPPVDYAIAGWPINLYNLELKGSPLVQSTVTGADGTYEFVIPDNGTYIVCEGTKPGGYVQTAPNAGTTPPAGESITNLCPAPNIWGYAFTLTGTENFRGNDFGNRIPSVTCKEDPPRAPQLTRTVNTSKALGGGGVPGNPKNYWKVQDAYNAALADPSAQYETIGLFSKTVENLVLGGNESLTITQCESAQVTAANSYAPVWKITNTKKLLIIGPDSVGGTIGWELCTGGHELKSIRANGASVAGVRILSNSNKVSWNAIAGNPIGLDVLGSSNELKGGTIGPNSGVGVHFGSAATKNVLSGATIQDNAGNGVWIEGSSNEIKSNKLYRNLNGIQVKGNSNIISSNLTDANTADGINVSGQNNQFKDNKQTANGGDGFEICAGAAGNKLTSNASGSGENTGFEYRFGAAIVSGGSNKKDGSNFAGVAIGTYE